MPSIHIQTYDIYIYVCVCDRMVNVILNIKESY